jgi:hypothetical protein
MATVSSSRPTKSRCSGCGVAVRDSKLFHEKHRSRAKPRSSFYGLTIWGNSQITGYTSAPASDGPARTRGQIQRQCVVQNNRPTLPKSDFGKCSLSTPYYFYCGPEIRSEAPVIPRSAIHEARLGSKRWLAQHRLSTKCLGYAKLPHSHR